MNDSIKKVSMTITDEEGVHKVDGTCRLHWRSGDGVNKFGGMWVATDHPKGRVYTQGVGMSWTEAVIKWAIQKVEKVK